MNELGKGCMDPHCPFCLHVDSFKVDGEDMGPGILRVKGCPDFSKIEQAEDPCMIPISTAGDPRRLTPGQEVAIQDMVERAEAEAGPFHPPQDVVESPQNGVNRLRESWIDRHPWWTVAVVLGVCTASVTFWQVTS